MTPIPDWVWDDINPGKPAMSGDLAKLFKHESQKSPGVFEVDAPPDAATLTAREVIQNSWDAARELQAEDPTAPQFEIEFRFHEFRGEDKIAIAESLRLGSLAERASQIDRADIGLREHDCLGSLDDQFEPLRFLEIIERGATGMYGPWEQSDSQMYKALLSLGFTEKKKGAGGSYGYGKAGLISGSKIRNVVAYTCFRERDDDPGVTRRLLGMTYWGQHGVGGTRYTGFASLSASGGGFIDPFVNDEADRVAELIGLPLRSSDVIEHLGTTFLLPDPTLEPHDLVKAVERFWWPALVEGDLVVKVIDYDNTHLYPKPNRDEVLQTFIQAWELASGARERSGDEWTGSLTGPEGHGTVGTIGLVANQASWSYADDAAGPDDEPVDHKSLVALTRGPRMVVEYFVAGGTPPYLRGVFIADEEVDDALRLTEPKAHDSWQAKAEEGEVDADAAAIAAHVIARIRQTVANHRNRLKPPPPPPDSINLSVFNDIMRRVMSGAGGGVRLPVPESRPISIHLDYRPIPAGDQVRIIGSASFSFSESFEGDRAEVELSVDYRFMEDDRAGEHAELSIVSPDHFTPTVAGVYRGMLERDMEVRFQFQSESYDASWTGRLVVDGQVLDGSSEVVEDS